MMAATEQHAILSNKSTNIACIAVETDRSEFANNITTDKANHRTHPTQHDVDLSTANQIFVIGNAELNDSQEENYHEYESEGEERVDSYVMNSPRDLHDGEEDENEVVQLELGQFQKSFEALGNMETYSPSQDTHQHQQQHQVEDEDLTGVEAFTTMEMSTSVTADSSASLAQDEEMTKEETEKAFQGFQIETSEDAPPATEEEYLMVSSTQDQQYMNNHRTVATTEDSSKVVAHLTVKGSSTSITQPENAETAKEAKQKTKSFSSIQKEKKKRSYTEKSKPSASNKRKRTAKGTKQDASRGKTSSDAETDSDSYLSDNEEIDREFSRPSRRSLKNSPEFAKAYLEYSKAAQEKKAAESHFEKIKRQYEAALQRKDAAGKTLVTARDALYEADLQVSCYWNTMYHKLVKYKETHGHCMVPYTRGVVTDAEEKKLGAWVHCQRKNYHNYHKGLNKAKNPPNSQSQQPTISQGNHRMKPQRIVALEKLGFVWSFFDTKWSQRIKDLVAYKTQHGHLNVPFKYPPNQSLAHWVHNQRRDYNLFQEGKPSQMTVEKISELESFGFAWKSDYPRTKRKATPEPVALSEAELWEENYQALVSFHAKNGHCSVNRFTSPNRKLCAWLTWQRKQHKLYMLGRPSQLNPDRIKRLTGLGFEWTPKNKPGSGGLSTSTATVILPLNGNADSANHYIQVATNAKTNNAGDVNQTAAVIPPLGVNSDNTVEVILEASSNAIPMHTSAMKEPEQTNYSKEVSDDQAHCDLLDQQQNLHLLHAVEDDEVALMAQI